MLRSEAAAGFRGRPERWSVAPASV